MRVERKVPGRPMSGRWSSFPPRRRPDGLDLPAVMARSGAGSIHHVVERVLDALARGLALADSVDLPREAAVRLAAVGDLHFGRDSEGALAPWLDQLAAEADLLVIAGDLTQNGDPKEAEVASRELQALPIPKVAVLGNHDYDYGQEQAVAERLE